MIQFLVQCRGKFGICLECGQYNYDYCPRFANHPNLMYLLGLI